MSTAAFRLHSPPGETQAPGYSSGSDASAETGLRVLVKRLVTSIRQANAERRLRYDLAQLDDVILRDIGIARDEIDRIHAGEDFTPRSWSN